MGDPVPADDLPEDIPSPGDVASKFTKRLGMKVPSGAAVPSSDLPSYPVSYPSEIPAKMKSLPELIKQAAPPALAGVGVEAALTALGVPEVGLLPMLMRGVISGETNIATSKLLPEKYGGQPNASVLSDFAWGALPQWLSSGAKTGLNFYANKRLANAGERMRSVAEGSILDPENLKVQQTLLNPASGVPYPNINQGSALLTTQANQARAPIQQTIRGMRDEVGSQIGTAYKNLKGEEPLDENETQTLLDRFEGIQNNMISPSGLGNKYLNQLKGLAAKNQQTYAAQLQAQGHTPDVIKKYLAMNSPQEISINDLRNMWQQMGTDLNRTTSGGDKHALSAQRRAIDDVLLPKLPANMKDLRNQYRGIMTRWGYDQDNKLAQLADPNEIAHWTFQNPRDAYELYTNANPQQRTAMQAGFMQHIWGDLPTTEPGVKQAAIVRQRLAPYMQDPKVAVAFMGAQPAQVMGQMVSWAKYAPELKQQLEKNPGARDVFQEGFNEYFLRQGQKPASATVSSLQRMLGLGGAPGAAQIAGETPLQLPASAPSRVGRMGAVFGGRQAVRAAASFGIGNVGFGAYHAIEALSYLAGGHGFNAASKMGTTRFFINAFKANNPMSKGWLFARALDATAHGGAQYGRAALAEDQDDAPQ